MIQDVNFINIHMVTPDYLENVKAILVKDEIRHLEKSQIPEVICIDAGIQAINKVIPMYRPHPACPSCGHMIWSLKETGYCKNCGQHWYTIRRSYE